MKTCTTLNTTFVVLNAAFFLWRSDLPPLSLEEIEGEFADAERSLPTQGEGVGTHAVATGGGQPKRSMRSRVGGEKLSCLCVKVVPSN